MFVVFCFSEKNGTRRVYWGLIREAQSHAITEPEAPWAGWPFIPQRGHLDTWPCAGTMAGRPAATGQPGSMRLWVSGRLPQPGRFSCPESTTWINK